VTAGAARRMMRADHSTEGGATMTEPTIAQKAPYPVEVEAGKDYWWCACGNSKNQPFCDGSHKGTTFTPMKYSADASKTVYFCGCKHSANKPLCDGSHKAL
jgi:CDGSH-type Zn-finger protein